MRQKRAKAYRKLMHLYCMSFGFRQPYQVLVDSEFCKSAVVQKLDLQKQLHTVLQGDVKPMMTQCCIHELYLQGRDMQPAVDLAKTFERRKCNHREAIPGDECLSSVVGDKNKHRYVIASQLQPLRVKLRAIPATPLVHINRSVMVLEPPSDATLKAKESTEEQKLHASAPDLALVGTSSQPAPPPKKRKGLKGPNPLSVKKKKTEPGPQPRRSTSNPARDNSSTSKKRKLEDDESEHEKVRLDSDKEQGTATDAGPKKKRKRRRKIQTQLNEGSNLESATDIVTKP
ncbi:unnamed protein product [Cyclocybe aegerita]|uniref:U three protein 23 n=1 Tax=Cyclocybe aegerita TaxID=1973307 RepID=A0A8S0WVB4_CYCAE|nr:unnamed protein product [Cyclocybe aegerita]